MRFLELVALLVLSVGGCLVRKPQPAQVLTMILVALVGAGVNAASALLFMRARAHHLNLRSAFRHLASDAAPAVNVTGGIIMARPADSGSTPR